MRRLFVQPLERRVLLSTVEPLGGAPQDGIDFANGDLRVFGTDGPDEIRLELVLAGPPGAPDQVQLTLNGRTWRFDNNIRSAFIDSYGGDDFVHIQRGIRTPAQIRAAGGDDFMHGGSGVDEFFGGPGTDTVSYENLEDTAATIDLFVNFDETANDGDGRQENVHLDVENVIGSAGTDWIVGSRADIDNRFEGRGGDDVLSGNGGDDVLLGGPGDDELTGGDDLAGNDALGGGGGRDIFDGILEPADAAQDYPAEGAVLSGPVVSARHGLYQGNGYVDFTNATGDTLTFVVDVVDEGTYTLEFRYANGGASDRPLELNVNDRSTRRVSFPPTGGWDRWKTVTVDVRLEADPANQVTLRSVGSNGPNLDTLLVTPGDISTPAQPLPQTHQAEDAVYQVAAASATHAGYTGSGYLDFTTGSADVVEWRVVLPPDVEGPDERPVLLDFRYANGTAGDRPLEVRVNGVVVAPRLSFPSTGSWNAWRTASIAVPAGVLRAGPNTIRVQGTGQSGGNLDALTIRRGEQPPPGAQLLEAESARLSGPGVRSSNAGFTGGGYADFGESAGQSVEWDLNVAEGRNYVLEFRYANGGNAGRPLALKVDGGTPRGATSPLPFAPTGSWTTWRTASVTVSLSAGSHRVRLESLGAGPNVDSLTVRPA